MARAAAQISVAVMGFRKAWATAARWRPRFNHGTSFLSSDIRFVTTAGFIYFAHNPFGISGDFFGFGERNVPTADKLKGRFPQLLPTKQPSTEHRAIAKAMLKVKGVNPAPPLSNQERVPTLLWPRCSRAVVPEQTERICALNLGSIRALFAIPDIN